MPSVLTVRSSGRGVSPSLSVSRLNQAIVGNLCDECNCCDERGFYAPPKQLVKDSCQACSHCASFAKSRLPPERITPTRWPARSSLRCNKAAAPTAPDG